MSEQACTYDGNREHALMAFLYEEMAPDERRAFDAHAAACPACRTELAALRSIRGNLQDWAPPAVAGPLMAQVPERSGRARWWSAPGSIPIWAQVAAAALVMGVAAGISNLRVTIGPDGLSVRTGWSMEPAAEPAPSPGQPVAVVSHDELRVLAADLRRRIDEVAHLSQQDASDGSAVRTEALLRDVRRLIAESEKKQQTELALRLLTFDHDIQARRREDLRSIGLSLVKFREDTEAEVQRNRFEISTLATRVVSQPR